MESRAPDIGFVAAAGRAEEFPEPGPPEVALVGRSNVGKSSFLNALAGGKPVARTSRTPGRTRSVNFYRVTGRPGPLVVVDLPGYGYARVSKEERNRWKNVIENYLTRPRVMLAILIVDGRTGPTGSDRTMSDWLRHRRLRTLVAVTKLDKLGRAAARRAVEDASAALAIDPALVLPFSAVTGLGVREAWKAIGDRVTAAAGAASAPADPPPPSGPSGASRR